MVEGQAVSSDDERISEIRDIHVAGVGIGAHVCANCYDEWPCDTAYLLARVDALTQERDSLVASLDYETKRRNEAKSERDAAVARAELAEAARDRALIVAVRPLYVTTAPAPEWQRYECRVCREVGLIAETISHARGCPIAALAGSRAALAASSAEPSTVTTRTITIRCHCGRGVTIGPDPWCEGCVQSAATCDCVPATQGRGDA